jgi:peptidoglycan/xylan/chitin deacetylase (PgdA/CDA1 family)
MSTTYSKSPDIRSGARRDLAARLKSLVLLPIGTPTSMFDVRDEIALTFDDGPHPDVTPAVLDVLKRHDARATFFVMTEHAVAHPDVLSRIAAEGHEIALHFDRHDSIPGLPPSVAFARLRSARHLLEKLVGPVTLFRPPYGSQNLLTYFMARSLGLTVVGWSQCANDWMAHLTTEDSAGCVTHSLEGGDIVLEHDGLELGPDEPAPSLDRAQVADLILRHAAARGLKSVTVGALLKRGAVRRSRWFR